MKERTFYAVGACLGAALMVTGGIGFWLSSSDWIPIVGTLLLVSIVGWVTLKSRLVKD